MGEEGAPAVPERNPEADTCSFYVVGRRRFCKMRTKPGVLYCGEHRNLGSSDSGRVPCPYDGKQ